MLSKAKKDEAFYSFSKLLKFSINAYEHSINNYEVTSLKPCELQGHSIIDSIKNFKSATDMDDKFNKEIVMVEDLIKRLKEVKVIATENDRQYRLHH